MPVSTRGASGSIRRKDKTVAHEVETMFSARTLPWHFGETKDRTTISENVLTAAEAIKAAGLDWEVALKDLYVASGPAGYTRVPGVYAVERDIDNRCLGVVRTRYVPFQNAEAFSFTDSLVDSGDAKYETAGSLRDGRVIFLTMKVPMDLLVGGEDAHEMYIVLMSSHDGTKAITVFLTTIRVVCMNTLTLAANSARTKWSMPHVSTMKGKLQEARDTLELTFKYAEDFVIMGDQLLNTKVTDEDVRRLIDDIMPAWRKKADEVSDSIMALYKESPTNGYTGTGWGALNAITEYFDHGRELRSPDSRMLNALTGENATIRNKAAKILLSL